MPRHAILFVTLLAIWAFDPQLLWRQQAGGEWPPFTLGPDWRGPGFYLSIWKLATSWLLFLLWVYTTDWVSRDCQRFRFDYVVWNSIVVFVFLAAFLLVWFIPWYLLALVLLLWAYAAPLAVYILQRNKKVEFADRVMTKAHLRRLFATGLKPMGVKMAAADLSVDEQGPPLHFKPQGAVDERQNSINLLTARQSPGYIPARQAVFDAIEQGADSILFDFGGQTVVVRHQIDGVWHNQASLDRLEAGDPILLVLKLLAGLKPDERRAKQSSTIGVEIKKPGDVKETKYACKITCQGTKGGERVILVIEGKKLTFASLEDLGMRPKMREQLEEILGQPKGFVIVSAMPGGGLSTTFDVVLNSTDRFMRNFSAVEDSRSKEREILNVATTTFDAAAGETPATVLPKLIRTYPDVFVLRDLVNQETVNLLIEQVVKESRLVICRVPAKEAVEALLRVLMLKVKPADFAPVVTAGVNVRLVRKLCETCKEAYPPPNEVLKQLGLPPGRIEAFYRPPTQPIDPKHPEKVCEACQGIGYKGRTGIFELLVVDDALRAVLAAQPKLELLRDAARKSKHRSLQEEGLLHVAKGVTSLQELLRVLKQ